MSELEPTHALIPFTGEQVDLRDLPKVATVLAEIRELETQIRYAKRELVDALCAESARTGTSTFHFDGVDVSLTAAEETVRDLERMREELQAAGLPDRRLDELLVPTVTYEFNGNVARQLQGANRRYAQIIDACTEKRPKTRYARAERT